MKKIQCPNIEKGENVHKHYCYCCKGKQHIPFAVALKYELRGMLVLSDDCSRDVTDCEMHERIQGFIEWYKKEHGHDGKIDFKRESYGEPVATLNACIDTLTFTKQNKK